MRKKVLDTLLQRGMIVLLLSVSIYASVLTYKEAQGKRLFLQVGAFSKESSLQRAVESLQKYPLWIDRSGTLKRLFVVLPRERRIRRVYLKKLKSIVPGAFLKRGYTLPSGANSAGTGQLPPVGKPLDADAILHTRKKFF